METPRLSDAEWMVMRAVWTAHPTTARKVLEQTADERGWAYSTVKTLLTRLVEKGALAAHREGITTVYAPLLGEDDARREAAEALAARAFDGNLGSLMHFLVEDERLSKRARRELKRRLEELSEETS